VFQARHQARRRQARHAMRGGAVRRRGASAVPGAAIRREVAVTLAVNPRCSEAGVAGEALEGRTE